MNRKLVFVLILILLVLSLDVNTSHSSSDFPKVARPSEDWVMEKVTDKMSSTGWNATLALDSNYSPHISYFYNHEGIHRLIYVKRSGSTWDEQIVDFGLYVGDPSSIRIDKGGNIHIGYGANNEVRYAKNESGEWRIESVESRPDTWYQDVSLALDSSSDPYLSYYNWDTGEVLSLIHI